MDYSTKNIAFPSKTNYIPKIIEKKNKFFETVDVIKKTKLKKDKKDKETFGFPTT